MFPILTVEVILIKCEAIDECWNCMPTTAAAARWPLFSTNIAWAAVISGRSSPAPEKLSLVNFPIKNWIVIRQIQ